MVRNDKLCQCGKYRHWPCRICGQPTADHHDHAQDSGGAGMGPGTVRADSDDSMPGIALLADIASEAAQMIPDQSVLDQYIPRKIHELTDLEILQKCWEYNHSGAQAMNVLLIGDAGAGKNHLAEALGAWARMPVWSISLNGGSTVEDIVGQPLFMGGTTVWVDGVLTYAMRHGGIVVLDEVNACPHEITFVLHQILDHRRSVTLVQKGREVVRAHPNFMIIGTMNPDYRGTKPLNEAFRDRFHLPLEIEYDDKVEKKLGLDAKIRELAGKLRKMFRAGELDAPCSTRLLLDYTRNKTIFGPGVAKTSFLTRFSRGDQTAISEAWDITMASAQTANLEFANDE